MLAVKLVGRPATKEPTPTVIKKRLADRLRYYTTDSLLTWARYAIQNAKKRAKRRGLPFDLTIGDILPLAMVTTHCPILGCELEYARGRGNGGCRAFAASIDRVDNRTGYFPDGVRIISHRANTVKGNCTLHDMIALGRYARSIMGD